MAESVDALVSNTSGAIRAGSTPAQGTQKATQSLVNHVVESLYFFYRQITGKNGIFCGKYVAKHLDEMRRMM